MTDRLRETMRELGERAPRAVALPDGTFRRARRARRRDRMVAGAAALAAVGLVVWGGVATVDRVAQPDPVGPAGSELAELSPALPAHVYDPPYWYDDEPWLVAGGRATVRDPGALAVVFEVRGVADPVAVSALDGSYVLLDLPGRETSIPTGALADPHGPVLSPDGARIAYWWQDDSGSGVRVLDLGTGQWRDQPTPAGAVSGLQWSGDGRRLTYATYPLDEWGGGMGWTGPLDWQWRQWDTVGDTDRAWPDAAAGAEQVALFDDGQELAWVAGRNRLAITFADRLTLDVEGLPPSPTSLEVSAGANRATWVGEPGGRVRTSLIGGGYQPAVPPSSADELVTGPLYEVWAVRGGNGGQRLEPLSGAGATVLLEPGVRADSWSVATGLLSQPTRDAAEPDWPPDPRWFQLAVFVGVLVLVAAGYWSLLHRRRARDWDDPDHLLSRGLGMGSSAGGA